MKMKSRHIIDTTTIKWMRKRTHQSEISSLLTSLLLEKEEKKPMLLRLIENTNMLHSYTKTDDDLSKTKTKLQLNPTLFFNQTILNKVYQIRDIFLEFDIDRSRTLEISELLEMFNSNNIPITEDEMIDLFTTGKRKKIDQYRLTFLDIVTFSLSYEQCGKFRDIMKKVKERCKKGAYIPLDFNRALEFIYSKGWIKNGLQKIQNGIKRIEKLSKKLRDTKTMQLIPRKGSVSILSKWGVGRTINVNQVCKGFNDVIEASSDLMVSSIRQNHNYSKVNLMSFNKTFTSYKQSKLKDTSQSKLTNSTFHTNTNQTNNTTIPLISINKAKPIRYRKMIDFKKTNINFIYPKINSQIQTQLHTESSISNENRFNTII